ncbi:insulinase family protein [Mesorhizobium sp. YC-39]|uniref:M16 family metallopeptidase n=1 Tax=unclassified Mesorhizobium TaxID=325217 RepID=UPI0021E6E30D|nr:MULTISPECIES: pitrilysin family protein [unclassified Mesorhizobium]MCV3211566.1 insulinase family protein [Mesorhizobium sp. YC-2]MCV3233236.1 insulinase family protein [Mesorhizobium sp. YC-39]
MMTNQHRGAFAHVLSSPLMAEGKAARLAMPVAILLLAIFFLIQQALTAHAAMDIQEVKSGKGIKAWLVEDHTVPIVTIHFVFEGGTTQDPIGKEGLAYLMTGLFAEGAGDLDSDSFQVELDEAGAYMSFIAQRDRINGSMRMLSQRQDAAFDLLRLAVNRPRFDQEAFERIRAQVFSDIIAKERDPKTIAQGKWRRALYGTHPYSRPDKGTKVSLAGITPADLSAFHKAIFARDGLRVAVVGDIDAKTLSNKLDQLFGDLREKQTLFPIADVAAELGQHVEVNCDLPQTSLRLVFPGVARSEPQFFDAVLMNEILGGLPFTSRLYDEVREKRGLAYGVGSYLVDNEHSEELVVETATRSNRAAETLSIVRRVVNDMAQKGPTEAELEASKKYLIGAYAISRLDSSSSIAATLVDMQIDNLGIDYIQRRPALIDQVTLDQVKAAAKKLLSAEPSIMVVGPPLSGKG